MNRVWLYIERSDGQIERYLGPFERWLLDSQGEKVCDERGRPRYDETYAQAVYARVKGFDGASAYDVAEALAKEGPKLLKEETGVLSKLALVLVEEVTQRVQQRQLRAERGTLRAAWLADIELAAMKVRVKAE
jgi:hypothetical protein